MKIKVGKCLLGIGIPSLDIFLGSDVERFVSERSDWTWIILEGCGGC
jgi:hypothetical protein